jgi:hypothetical protein
MNNTTYKYIALLVIGILVGYLFGISNSNNDDVLIDTESDDESSLTDDNSTGTTTTPGYLNQVEGESPAVPYVKDVTASTVNPGTITVSDQVAMSSVHVDKIILEQDGWIAIHEYKYGDLAGFVIGAHRKPAGVYENLDLWINRKMVVGEKYIVVIHKDDAVEGFNYKTDTPRIGSEGKVVAAVFTATE